MKRFVMSWALAGLLVPMALLLLARLQGGTWEWPYLTMALWPSVVFAAAADTVPNVPVLMSVLSLTTSMMMNVGIYAALGGVLWTLSRLYKRPRAHRG
ncbi:MAG: hypothetical protein ACE5MM_08795 [Nitrospiraceae bacterium]